MELYTERYGIRAPREKTYNIDRNMYEVLLNCVMRYKINLVPMFNCDDYDDFTNHEYIKFDERKFIARIKLKIPEIYMNEYGEITTPVEDKYNQYGLIDLIEYFAKNIQDVTESWNNEQYQNYKIIKYFDTKDIFVEYQNEINEIFNEAGLLYKLTDDKIIERIVENSPLTEEMEDAFQNIPENGIRGLLNDAVSLYKTPHPHTRQDSIEKIWDALERLKTYYIELDKRSSVEKIVNSMAHEKEEYIELFNDEFKKLTSIGNKYRIRHHETDKIDIMDERYYDYLFNRCLSLIALAIQYL